MANNLLKNSLHREKKKKTYFLAISTCKPIYMPAKYWLDDTLSGAQQHSGFQDSTQLSPKPRIRSNHLESLSRTCLTTTTLREMAFTAPNRNITVWHHPLTIHTRCPRIPPLRDSPSLRNHSGLINPTCKCHGLWNHGADPAYFISQSRTLLPIPPSAPSRYWQKRTSTHSGFIPIGFHSSS